MRTLPPSDISRFSILLDFESGETKRYDFKGNFGTDETAQIDGYVFTDKIFRHGRVAEHIAMPEWTGYRHYPQRGQGIEFINGYAISTAELYWDSYPIGTFSYSEMGDVFVAQDTYDEDGFALGRISDLDPTNPLYLLDRNTMTAKTLPQEYQQTRCSIYPFVGGCSEGRVMVNTMGEITLQYHHRMYGSAGMWGWLDMNLDVVIPPQYLFAQNFVNGQAIVCKGKWDVKVVDGKSEYWCENEQWGVIDRDGNEVIPCMYDDLFAIDNTDRLFLVHEGGWENGHGAVYDVSEHKVILVLDFPYDPSYMFNECWVSNTDQLIFTVHKPGEGVDLVYAYDLHAKIFILHGDEHRGRTLNGERRVVVNRDGMDIIVF